MRHNAAFARPRLRLIPFGLSEQGVCFVKKEERTATLHLPTNKSAINLCVPRGEEAACQTIDPRLGGIVVLDAIASSIATKSLRLRQFTMIPSEGHILRLD
jgi:hypothetical protein